MSWDNLVSPICAKNTVGFFGQVRLVGFAERERGQKSGTKIVERMKSAAQTHSKRGISLEELSGG